MGKNGTSQFSSFSPTLKGVFWLTLGKCLWRGTEYLIFDKVQVTCCAFLCSPLPVCMCEWERVCVLYRRMCTEESRFFMRSFKGGEHYVEIVHVDEWSGKKCLSLVCFSRKRALASLQSTNYYYYPSTKIVIWKKTKRIDPNEHFVEKGVIGPTVIRHIRGWWGHRTISIALSGV